MAKSLYAVPMSIKEANDFVVSFHRHHGSTTWRGKFAIGCSNGRGLVGVAIVGLPTSATYMDGFTAEVTRTCVKDDAPKGANSFLYSRCWRAARAMGYRRMITYTLQSESGASLRGAGWKVVAEVKPHNAWKAKEKMDGIFREWRLIYGQLKLRWEVADR